MEGGREGEKTGRKACERERRKAKKEKGRDVNKHSKRYKKWVACDTIAEHDGGSW